MDTHSPYKKDWALTQEAFEKMLSSLDPDRHEAGRKYEGIRQKLTKLFRWRCCPAPETFTDTTIDRVARRLQEGAELRTANPYLFFHGVALNVLREHWKSPKIEARLDELPASLCPSYDPHAQQEREAQQETTERRLECLDGCLQQLSTADREVAWRYHHMPDGNRMEARALLAQTLNMPINALRIRVCRIRAGLERCIENCLGGPSVL